MMKKLNYAVVATALLGFAGFSGQLLAEDAAKKEQKAESSQTEPSGAAGKPAAQPAGEEKQAEQGKPDDKLQAKPGDAAQAKKDEGGVKVQDYSKAGAYKDGKPVSGSTGQTAERQSGEKEGAAGPAAPAEDPAKKEKAGEEKKQ